MSLEALWALTFGTEQRLGAGVVVFETGRIFGGDGNFYYLGHYDYNTRDQTISGEVAVIRHAPGLLWVPKTHRHKKPADEHTCDHAARRS